MLIGWFGRCFNKDHKSLSTKTHIVKEGKVLCGYIPHKTMEFQFCSGISQLEYLECDKCKIKLEKIIKRRSKK